MSIFTRIIIILLLPIFISCNRQNRYAKAKQLLDVSVQISIENLDSAANIIKQWPKLPIQQAVELRENFCYYQMVCADMMAWELERKIDSIAFSSNINGVFFREKTDSLLDIYSKYEIYGIKLNIYEGEVMAEIMPDYEAEVFQRYLSKCEQELQKILQKEAENPCVIDEEIVVDYNIIARRLLSCDVLIDKYENDNLLPVIDGERKFYLSLFMYGTDNTPAFNWETNTLRPTIKSVLEKYISKHPHAHSTTDISEFLHILKKSNYKRSIETDFFISKTFSIE
ncbi:MAG: hypothetical protein Q4D14_04035 [Bacteroidales bacterium]|nr:hypothetical protein [Bacteroidales bacterium]